MPRDMPELDQIERWMLAPIMPGRGHLRVARRGNIRQSVIWYILTRHTNGSVSGCRMGAMVVCRIYVSFA